jgi:hypothetical protein
MKRHRLNKKEIVKKKIELRHSRLNFIEKSQKDQEIVFKKKNDNIKPIIGTINKPMRERDKLRIFGKPENLKQANTSIIHKGDSTYRKRVFVEYDTIICIPSFNRLDKVIKIITQIKKQNTKYTYKIIILDDGSDENYNNLIKLFPNIRLLKNEYNYGKKQYWLSITKLFSEASKYAAHTIIQIDDDFILCDGFIDKLLDKFFEIKYANDRYVAIYYHRPFGLSLNNNRWGLGGNWIDGGGLYDFDFLKSIEFSIDNISIKRWKNKDHLSSGVWLLISRYINNMNLLVYVMESSLAMHDGNNDSKMNPSIRKDNPIITENFYENS